MYPGTGCELLSLTTVYLSDGKEGKSKEVATVTKPKAKSSSSIAGIAQCWQGVVQRQVKPVPALALQATELASPNSKASLHRKLNAASLPKQVSLGVTCHVGLTIVEV